MENSSLSPAAAPLSLREQLERRSALTGHWQDRAAELRGPAAAGDLARHPARVLPVWRGRPMVCGAGGERLVWLEAGHPALRDARTERIFLGLSGGAARFVADVSRWEPEGIDRAAMAMFVDTTEYPHPDLPPDHLFRELRQTMNSLDPGEAALASTARALLNWHRTHRFCSSCGQPSEPAMSGWQRDCPACGAHHFPRTDPVVIMLVKRGNKVLLGRSPGWPEGMYSTLAGFVEPGETLETAVRREVREETGIHVGEVRYLASQPWPWPNSLMLGFVAEALDEAIQRDAELEDALWLSREEVAEILGGLHPVIRRPRNGAIAHTLLEAWLRGELD